MSDSQSTDGDDERAPGRKPGAYNFALDQARKDLDGLITEMGSVRTRAIAVLSGAGLIATFFGAFAVRNGQGFGPWTSLAMAAFTGTAVLVVMTIWPRPFDSTNKIHELVGWVDNQGLDEDACIKDLALHIGEQYEGNAKAVEHLQKLLVAATITLLSQIAFSTIDLMTGIQ